jgi:hypothetical protein
MISGRDTTVAAWADSRLGNATNGRQDIVAAAAAFPRPRASRWVLVAVAAVAVVAATALGLSWRRRRP